MNAIRSENINFDVYLKIKTTPIKVTLAVKMLKLRTNQYRLKLIQSKYHPPTLKELETRREFLTYALAQNNN